MAQEPTSTTVPTKWVTQILNANSEKAGLQAVLDTTRLHPSLQDKNKLQELFEEFQELFDGKVGDWKTGLSPLN